MVNLAIFVDLDRTLIRTDLLAETIVEAVLRRPVNLLLLLRALLSGRAALKSMAARLGDVPVEHLPYNEPLLEWLRGQKAQGRRIILATAAHRTLADRIARHLGLFDAVLASDASHNNKGEAKLAEIRRFQADAPFAYAGDSEADRPLWRAAQSGVFVDAPKAAIEEAKARGAVERVFTTQGSRLAEVVRALRLYQWAKNALLLVPLLAAHLYGSAEAVVAALLGVLAFGLCASAIYIVNDLSDLAADRKHPRKRKRPFAAGTLPIEAGVLLAPLLLLAAFAVAVPFLPGAFTLVLFAYLVATTLYTFVLKRIAVLDVLTLAGLYTLRIVAGAAAIGVAPSFWLLALSLFLFTSLAFAKRYTELASLATNDGRKLAGRGYSGVDAETTFTIGTVAGLVSVLVMALFINSPDVSRHYATPEFLWGLCPALLYWVARIWTLARRGELHDDPVVFALRDRASIATGGVCALFLAVARIGI